MTYAEVGATRHALPPGYRHIQRTEIIGTGADTFQRAGEALDHWTVHRAAGLRVLASGPANQPGVDAVLLLGTRRLQVSAACRVVYAIQEPNRRGFAYGTLAGHPETGEEAFLIHLGDDGRVTFSIAAFSRPQRLAARLGGPLTHAVQEVITSRYFSAVRRLAAGR
ncbi:DUF1990 domain-containing protein [Micromonospora craterilacus]|uniref:DUF1990 domain-containing protein n=1 Tax=Micromonospora craterilacus TaxID=1655439 RepID=A0A2W2FGV6_9ACTN|nr:DUF1990 domain-containing protein [Micromonospora craterilacus]